MDLTIIIPCYNEASRDGNGTLVERLGKIKEFTEPRMIRCIFVVDGCTDDTNEQIVHFADENELAWTVLVNDVNMGKGYSITRAVQCSETELTMYMDADLAVDLSNVTDWIKDGEKNCIAEREVEGGRSFIRSLGSKVIHSIVQHDFALGFEDTQCGFKLFETKHLKYVVPYLSSHHWFIDIEILYLFKQMGIEVHSRKVAWRNDNNSTLKPIKECFKILSEYSKVKRHLNAVVKEVITK